jgi:hypothetical protein
MDFAERLAGRDPHLSDKSSRGNASQFFIAGELCRRGYSAVVTLGNTPKRRHPMQQSKGNTFRSYSS